jgi:rhamnosyltransferase
MKTGCIIVLYNQNDDLLSTILNKILEQVNELYLVDNSSTNQASKFDGLANTYYNFLGGNIGIAKAQNEGIKYFIQKEYDYLIFLDQDSIPPKNLVRELTKEALKLQKKGIILGAIGPRPFNIRENKPYKGLFKPGKIIAPNLTQVTELISSASLIPIKNFLEVGLFEGDLFIDSVDHEWCWRASFKLKCQFFILETIILDHMLGEGDRTFLFMKVAIPTPFRVFYQYRNFFTLLNRSYVPIYWKLSNGLKYFIKFFYYSLILENKKEYFNQMNKGIKAGLRSQIKF